MQSSPRRRHRMRLGASAVALLGLAAGALAAGAGGAAVAAPAAAPGEVAASQTVVSGDARFQVLSPTLIRTEYAGDGRFDDAGTFNVIGRGGFAPAQFTTSSADGWLTIDTGSAVVRYREGSGDFGPDNLTLSLTTSTGQDVTAAPWPDDSAPSCEIGVLCEAESLTLQGLGVAKNHTGYTGGGFVAGFEAVGNALSFDTDVETDGAYDLTLRYANNRPGDGSLATRTLTVTVDGGAAQTLQLTPTDSWDTWALATAPLDLTAGAHTVRVERTAGDSGNVNVDSLALVTRGTDYPGPVTTPAAADCAFGSVCEAESSTLAGGAVPATDHNGFSGDSFVAGLGQGATQTVHVTDVPAAGTYALQIRYANGQPTSRPVSVQVGSAAPTTVDLPATSGWDYWQTVSAPVDLAAGANDVVLGCPDADSCQLNVDTVALTASDSPILAAHAALGGYRRDLDTANGSVKTNPGLLYQDGWSLVDDTASALYDPATEEITPRDHGGADYSDGYLFAYGTDYEHALGELAQLTGPSMLLPQWAYGVWYSEYYDRTQEEFLAIADRFASEGVPVDLMAVDTDYKSPDKWNGWEIDTTRFPDMAAFLAELESRGIHNTLNIHPTIGANDPKFPAAQATANGALTQSGDKYLFDWSDPAQLQAYFDLHTDIQDQGVDLWWLDWCCSEGSQYSQPGVTPDAFINQQYANQTSAALDGRGFAFSRAYGSLTAGGYGNPQPVPTGPWADKRTTLHFTGDTVSTWQMLAAQVGYTPGESAATGLSAISHDIGGHTGGDTHPGAEPDSTQLADDLYARWVQYGTFQPIDRLHSNHSDRLPWQYGEAADASASQFLNLRENLVPLSYTLAAEAQSTGVPVTRPLYLQYPDQQEAYGQAGREYLYGSDVLVAPVTTPGETADTSVWFPAGDNWVDWFTGEVHAGGTTATVTTGLDRMPVFVRAGGIVPSRSADVPNASAPLTDVTLSIAAGADGSFDLCEDDGGAADVVQSATTAVTYAQQGAGGTLAIAPAAGSFAGQVTDRTWTAEFSNVDEPVTVLVDGVAVPSGAAGAGAAAGAAAAAAASGWTYDAATRTLTVPVSTRSVSTGATVTFSPNALPTPALAVGLPTVAAGSTQTVTGSGFPADTDIALTTTPDLGAVTAHTDAAGAFTEDLPVAASAAAGDYTVVASMGGAELARATFGVTAAGGPGTGPGTPGGTDPGSGGGSGSSGGSGTGGSNGGDLASTGFALPGALLAASALIAGGAALTWRLRRRRVLQSD